MAGKATRNKGKAGEREAKALLASRDWIVHDLENGMQNADMLASDQNGIVWSVEVKNCASIQSAHRKQAMEQASRTRTRWMLLSKITGTSSWLVQRQNERPVVWHLEKM